MGRPRAERPEVRRAWPAVRFVLEAGALCIRAAAPRLRVGEATVRRMLGEARAGNGVPTDAPEKAL